MLYLIQIRSAITGDDLCGRDSMSNQDKRAVESLCRCGLDFDGVCACFSSFPKEEIREIYTRIHKLLANFSEKNTKIG